MKMEMMCRGMGLNILLRCRNVIVIVMMVEVVSGGGGCVAYGGVGVSVSLRVDVGGGES